MSTNSGSTNCERCVADALGLGRLSDGESLIDEDLLRDLYRHARGEDGHRQLINDATFAKGWCNLDSPRARELVAPFLHLEDECNLNTARRKAKNNLEAQPWNDALSIESPPISCKVKIHGAKWAFRFQAASPTKRGDEVLNEHLPGIGTVPRTGADTTPLPPEVAPDGSCPAGTTDTISHIAAITLSQAGFPS